MYTATYLNHSWCFKIWQIQLLCFSSLSMFPSAEGRKIASPQSLWWGCSNYYPSRLALMYWGVTERASGCCEIHEASDQVCYCLQFCLYSWHSVWHVINICLLASQMNNQTYSLRRGDGQNRIVIWNSLYEFWMRRMYNPFVRLE